MTSTTGQLPAVVTILDLGSATLPLDSTMVFEAVQSSNGTMISVQVPLTAIMTTVQGALPTGGGTGQILNKTNANNYSTQWSSITQFVAVGTGLATSGSATSIVVGLSPPVSVPNGGTNATTFVAFGAVYANGTATLAATSAGTTGWPLLGNGTSLAPSFQQLNLASTGFTGVLPYANGGSNASTAWTQGSVIFAGTSALAQSNASFFWDNANSRLGIGTSAPSVPVHVAATGTAELMRLESTAAIPALNILSRNGGGNFGGTLQFNDGTTASLYLKSIAAGGGRFNILGTDRLQVNTVGNWAFGQRVPVSNILVDVNQNASAALNPDAATALLRLLATDGSACLQVMQAFAGTSLIRTYYANGTSGGPTAVASGNSMMQVAVFGHTGAAYATNPSARITINATETFNATSNGGNIVFSTINTGTTSIREAMRIQPSGGASIGTTVDDGFGSLVVSNYLVAGGSINFTGNARQFVVSGEVGATQPGVAMYHSAAGAGNKAMIFIYDGSTALTNPGMLFQNITDTGSFVSNSMVFWRDGGATFGDVTYPGSAGAVRAQSNAQILASTAIPAGGTAGSGYKFSSASNFGVFFGSGVPSLSAATGSLYLRSDGATNTTRMYVNTNGTGTWTAVNTVA